VQNQLNQLSRIKEGRREEDRGVHVHGKGMTIQNRLPVAHTRACLRLNARSDAIDADRSNFELCPMKRDHFFRRLAQRMRHCSDRKLFSF